MSRSSNVILEQRAVTERFNAQFLAAADDSKLGIALQTLTILPLNGMRLTPESGTCGWYVWGGDYSHDDAFFQPLHVSHISQRCPQILPYLGLAPGWRFLLAPSYEDVWFDLKLLNS